MQLKRVVIMAGGTGGHVFPALAIATALKEQGASILWLGTRGRMEEALVPKYGFDIEYIDVRGIRGNGALRKLTAPFMILKSIMQSRAILKKFKPDLVIGMGGYAAGPGGMSAYLCSIPLVLHEQNASAGMTNKILSRFAKVIFLGFPGAFEGSNVVLTGNPVRKSIVALHDRQRDFTGRINILIVGGSLGAKALNDIVPGIINNLNVEAQTISVTHQTGRDNSDKTYKLYRKDKFEVSVVDFIDDMDKAFEEAHLVICRAGALTCAEVGVAGLPAIFVPLPSAVDDHQTKNAMTMVSEGASLLVAQKDLSDKLPELLQGLIDDRSKLGNMAQQAKRIASIDATDKIIKKLSEL